MAGNTRGKVKEKFEGVHRNFEWISKHLVESLVLIEDQKLTDSLAKKIEKEAGVKGFISTDELPKYGLNKQDKRNIEEAFGVKEGDVIIMVADQREKAEKAIQIIEAEIAKRKE